MHFYILIIYFLVILYEGFKYKALLIIKYREFLAYDELYIRNICITCDYHKHTYSLLWWIYIYPNKYIYIYLYV